eukprot:TRINITY_DN830_c0_g1_i2.p1 TRINITY_DN830_c0_g1~~TRINITY_DN830_c0_g1_i2.p1  ORF type:complete len:549 (+),score=126.20 TRINITY_DN830_c0_g1_i2:85-1647(+)
MDPAIAAALEEAGLSDCLEALQRNEVLDFDTLSSLTDDDLACVVSDPDKRGAMMRALEGIGGAPAAPPAGTQRRRSSAQRQGLARYQSLLRRRGELMRSGAREGLPELEAELEGLRESLGTGEALGSETSRGDRVRLVHDVAQLTANCVSGAQLATQWAGRIATVDSIGLDGSLTLRLPNNRTCSVRPQAVCPPSAGDPRRPSAARDAWGPRPQRRSSAASTAPAAAAAAAAQQAAPAGSAFPLSPQSEAPPRPRPARPRRSRQAASQPTPKPGSPRGFSEPGEREPWGRPVPFGERHRRRAAEARRYGVSRGCRTDPYCLQGTTMSLASTLRRGQRPAVAPPAAAPAAAPSPQPPPPCGAWEGDSGADGATDPGSSLPADDINATWAQGMARRDKKFELIRKRRQKAERAAGLLRGSVTMEARVRDLQNKVQQHHAAPAGGHAAGRPRQQSCATPARRGSDPALCTPQRAATFSHGHVVEGDIEVRSLGSTGASAASAAALQGLRRTPTPGSRLPPLGR